jgi:hypothetical protein
MAHKFEKRVGLYTVRFTSKTLEKKELFQAKSGRKCIYGSAHPIKRMTYDKATLMVIEMNNDINKINGVGLIKNTEIKHQKEKYAPPAEMAAQTQYFYKHIYTGDEWIGREDMREDDLKVVDLMEGLLFRGKGHCKRLTDITEFPPRFLDHIDFVLLFMRMFEEKRLAEAVATDAVAKGAVAKDAVQ